MTRFQIISGSDISEFKFFADGAIYKGAIIHNGIYKLIAQYPSDERVKACALACAIEYQGHYAVISTESDGTRKVWAEIRSLVKPMPLVQLYECLSSM
ncbi:MAG: hypothetical protein ACTS2F_03955 [Thainema sp.]